MTLQTYLVPYLHYGELVSRHRLYYGGPKNIDIVNQLKTNSRPMHRFIFEIINLLFVVPYTLMMLGVNVRQWHFTDVLFRVLPQNATDRFLVCSLLWHALYLSINYWSLGEDLQKARFTAVFVVHSDIKSSRGINRRDLGLTKPDFDKLSQLQRHLLTMFQVISVNSTLLLSGCCVFQLCRSGVISHDPWLSFFWLLIITIWLVVCAATIYVFPILLSVLIYYLWLKYKHVERKLVSLTHQLSSSCFIRYSQ